MNMGKKLDTLLGRNFNSKFKTVIKLAILRGTILKNQHQARYAYAMSDVIELLNLGYHDRALTRVEYVIQEKNMLDALVMIEDYSHLLIQRVSFIQNDVECPPNELKEAISSLIFASSRCGGGEFPELQKIREILSSRFGTEFAARAVELRNNCGVNPKIVQKLSSRRCSLESRLNALDDISFEMGITLHLDETICALPVKEKLDKEEKPSKPTKPASINALKLQDNAHSLPEELNPYEKSSESVKATKYFRDVAAAAQDAFESAAEAAIAAFGLTRSESQGSNDPRSSSHHPRIASSSDMSMMSDLKSDKYALTNEEDEDSNSRMGLNKNYTIDSFGLESEGEDATRKTRTIHSEELEENEMKAVREITRSASSSDSDGDILTKQFLGLQYQNEQDGIVVASDEDDNLPWQKHLDLDFHKKLRLPFNEHYKPEYAAIDKQYPSDEYIEKKYQLPAEDSLKSQDESRKTNLTSTQGFAELLHTHQHSNIDWKKFSVRTKQVQKA